MAVPPEAVWRVIGDTKRWPQFYATRKEHLHLRTVEYLDGATQDGLEAKRRLHFLGVPTWDEQATKWRENEFMMWTGIRNPGQKYWTQQLEIVPGKAYCTLRWDIFYKLNAPRAARKVFKRTLEDIMLSSLERIEKMASHDAKK